jgi:hypothetical protein
MAALTASQILKARQALHQAYSATGMRLPWTKPEIDKEISTIDKWRDLNQTLITQQSSLEFQSKTSNSDLDLIFILVEIAHQLIDNPAYLNILRQILDSINGIDRV